MGTLGGIGELAREVLGGDAPKPPAAAPAQDRCHARRSADRSRRTEDRRLMLDNLEPGWLWVIGGVLLLIAEIIAPGFFLVFVGAAAIATGAFTLLFGLGTGGAARPVRALRARRGDDRPARGTPMPRPTSSDPLLNDRGARLVGKTVTVVEAVDDHGGRVRVGDSEWNARGGPAAAGERVRDHGGRGQLPDWSSLTRTPSPS